MPKGKLLSVRFNQPALLGLNQEPCSSVTDGQYIDAAPVTIGIYDEMFFKVQFKAHMQLIPWATIGSAMFADEESKKAK